MKRICEMFQCDHPYHFLRDGLCSKKWLQLGHDFHAKDNFYRYHTKLPSFEKLAHIECTSFVSC